MMVIADIGGSKSDWRIVNGEKIEQFQLTGFNPTADSTDEFLSVVPFELIESQEIDAMYIYLAGLTNDPAKFKLHQMIQSKMQVKNLVLENDVLGTARGLFGKDDGIVCILGTGAAASYYNADVITSRIPSLGYVLGDEGSGFELGKIIIAKYLRGQLPSHLINKFEVRFPGLTEELMLQKVYKGEKPNAYIASFASFVIENQKDPFIYQMVYDAFSGFIKALIKDSAFDKTSRVRFTGSIAYFMSNILMKAGRDHQINIDRIVQSPIAGLTLYHQQNG